MKAIIIWFARNSVAANLTMAMILLSGLLVLPLLDREIAPELSFDRLEIYAAYPGAGPTQVEQKVSQPIERSLVGIEGILDVSTEARKGISITTVEVSSDFRLADVLNKVRARVDSIGGFPKEVSRPVVTEIIVKQPVMVLALTGEYDIVSMNNIAVVLAQQLQNLQGVSIVYVKDAPSRSISVEMSHSNLQKYQISFRDVVNKIRTEIVDLAGATVNAREGDVSIIGQSKVRGEDDLRNLVIFAQADGARIRLSDLAEIKDQQSIDRRYKNFDGENVVYIGINRGQQEDLIELAKVVHGFVHDANTRLPEGLSLEVPSDISEAVKGRIDLLTENAFGGFFLVLVVLLIFMNVRLSFWTSLGIPISFLGAFAVLYMADGTINMVSLFGFILVLGIVVDDAIIVGESIHSQNEKGNVGIGGAIEGVLEVYKPVLFAVITTMIAFAPMLFMPGVEGRLILFLPIVVIAVLAFSLIESLLILPAHLSSIKSHEPESIPVLNTIQNSFSSALDKIITRYYRPFLELCLEWRYSAVMIFFSSFIFSIGLLTFNWVNIDVVSKIESDMVITNVRMVQGSSMQETTSAVQKVEAAARQLQKELNEELGFDQIIHVDSVVESNTFGRVSLFLDVSKDRVYSGAELGDKVEKIAGDIPRLNSMSFRTSLTSDAPAIDVELAHLDVGELEQASQELKNLLGSYEGVRWSYDTIRQGKREVVFDLKPEANDMGVTLAQVAAQVREAFHGSGVSIYDENNHRVGVSIHYPAEQRNSLWFLENMNIKLRDGSYVPLEMVANLTHRDGPSVIYLHNGKRTIRVKAAIDKTTSAGQVMGALRSDFLNNIGQKYPGMSWRLAGSQKQSNDILDYLAIAFPLSMLAMYLLMATLFASYSQPLMIMYAIPFGIVGALIGHVVMGEGVTLWSLIGIIAVSGVVVNDNLVLVDRINQSVQAGAKLTDAIRDAGVARFRPIVLTSLTTFLGLVPVMYEDSMQAQFLVPMAVSLAFGVLFATVISLILVPVLYNILHDLQQLSPVSFVVRQAKALIKFISGEGYSR